MGLAVRLYLFSDDGLQRISCTAPSLSIRRPHTAARWKPKRVAETLH
jgi:hypothetical protein